MGIYVPGTGSGSSATVAPGDAIANPGAIPETVDFNLIWNQTNGQWSRLQAYRDWLGGVGSPFQVPAVGLLGFDSQNGGNPQQLALLGNAANSGDAPRTLQVFNASSIPFADTAAANTAISRVFAAVATQRNRLTLLVASFSVAAPAAGTTLIVQDGATTVLSVDVPTALGPFVVPLPAGGIQGTINTAMTVTLAAGGGTSVGKLSTAKVTA